MAIVGLSEQFNVTFVFDVCIACLLDIAVVSDLRRRSTVEVLLVFIDIWRGPQCQNV